MSEKAQRRRQICKACHVETSEIWFDISRPWCKQRTTQCHVARYFHTSSASGHISINIKQYSIIMPVGTPLMYTKSAKADLWQGPMFPFEQWRSLQPLSPGASSKGVWWKWAASPDPPGWSNGSSADFKRFIQQRPKKYSPLLWYNLCLGLRQRASCAPSLT